jgi:hypothetical protein
MKSHKLGVKETHLVKRHLKLTGSLNKNDTLIVADIEQLFGVDSVTIDSDARRLDVHYDASKRQLDDITTIIKEYGCELASSRWHRFKLGWYRYFDQNIKENAAKEPWHCH